MVSLVVGRLVSRGGWVLLGIDRVHELRGLDRRMQTEDTQALKKSLR